MGGRERVSWREGLLLHFHFIAIISRSLGMWLVPGSASPRTVHVPDLGCALLAWVTLYYCIYFVSSAQWDKDNKQDFDIAKLHLVQNTSLRKLKQKVVSFLIYKMEGTGWLDSQLRFPPYFLITSAVQLKYWDFGFPDLPALITCSLLFISHSSSLENHPLNPTYYFL